LRPPGGDAVNLNNGLPPSNTAKGRNPPRIIPKLQLSGPALPEGDPIMLIIMFVAGAIVGSFAATFTLAAIMVGKQADEHNLSR
jgi:hypothetical protein